MKVIPNEASQGDWTKARLDEQLKYADEVVAVLRAAGAVDRVDKAAFPRIISNGWFEDKYEWFEEERFETYPQPSINIRVHFFETPSFSIKGRFTAKGAEERLISEPIGYVDRFSQFGFGSVAGILDEEGRMNYQWLADDSVDEPELCFDAVSGLDHVRLTLHPLGSAHHWYSIYMHYDADSGQLVEGFDDYWFGYRTAEPGEDGACNWRKAKRAVETYKNIISALRLGESVPTNYLSLITMTSRTIERTIAESSLAALRALPSDVAEVRSLESPRWEVVEASMAHNHRYPSYERGILLVRDKEQESWRSILDCPFTDILKLQDNTLLFDVNKDCDRSQFNSTVDFRLNLITMQAITMSLGVRVDPEHIDDYRLEDGAVQADCEQVDPGNIAGMDESALAGEMVLIPGETFRMGDMSGDGRDNEKPVHNVTVPAFKLGRYEVTFAQWAVCVADGGCNDYSPDDRGWGRCNRPMTPVSWNDAHSFIAWLNTRTGGNYRLPTDAEWEYAARAGSTTKYHFGDDVSQLCHYANHNDSSTFLSWGNETCSDGVTWIAEVGRYRPNAFGLYDMHGNVSEWVQDCWNDSYAGAPKDGSAWTSGNCDSRVFRGGSWSDHPRRMSSAFRSGISRTDRAADYTVNIGFRLAHDR